MRKPTLWFALLYVWLFLALPEFPAGASEALGADLKRGQEIYQKYCMECHGNKGRGDGPRAPLLAPRPGNLVSAATSSKSDAELLGIITNGAPRTAMRGWKDELTEEDRLNVLAFVRSLVRFQKPSLTPPPPE
ncbi:MAG: cytochrome c [Nitrospirales bacterium]|nr:cytochrome c [Nitrospirales bacterium]